ncbi:meiosis initiator protein isoform X2 [Pelodiscus sinensis]|uniref:meiosis initiator protein isoform X2 n=1 Tax=Pelodiscus sinensis TaxID=13735 RepID=UPI003F6B62CC
MQLQMWGQIGRAGPWEPRPSRSSCQPRTVGDGKRRGNYTHTLRELAQMLPVPLHSSYKKLTKEILSRVLRYIEHLQSSIGTARALLRRGEKEELGAGASREAELSACQPGRGDGTPHGTPRRRRARLRAAGKKPRKGRRSHRAERRGVSKEPRRSLSLGDSPWQRTEADRRAAGDGDALCLGVKQLPSQLGCRDPAPGSHRPHGSAFPDSAEGGVPSCAADWCVGCDREASPEDGDICCTCQARLLCRGQRRYDGPDLARLGQELVQYHSCGEEDDGPDAGPWLSTQSPACSSRGSSRLCSPRSGGRIGACWASQDLGLSPSLFSSPGRLLPRHILQGEPEELSQGLFEDVCLSPQSAGSSDSLAGTLLRKSAFSLDHCYLSYSEASKTDSSPSSDVTEIVGVWSRPQLLQESSSPGPARSISSGDEASDSTWIPYKRVKPPPAASRKRKQGEGGAPSKSRPPLQLKKKCVNGFIMFCRLNRKQYIRACPGLASTAATRELAQLWRTMTKQERRPYCVKARRFSRLNNRIVKDFSSGGEEEEVETPKPFHLLLAEKSFGSRDLGLPAPAHLLRHPAPASA